MRIIVEGVGKKISFEERYDKWLRSKGVTCLIDSEGDEIDFGLLVEGGTYTLGSPIQHRLSDMDTDHRVVVNRQQAIPTKRIRDFRDSEIRANKVVRLSIGEEKILSPLAAETLSYFGRPGTQELFEKLVDD